MSRLIIKTGTLPNDKTGDSLFAAFNKVNANFEELYTTLASNTSGIDFGSVAASIIPTTDVTYDLGSLNKRFRHLYVGSGSITLGNTTLTITNGKLSSSTGFDLSGSIAAVSERLVNGNKTVSLNAAGALVLPNIFPKSFTATLNDAHYAGNLTLTGSPWTAAVEIVVDGNGDFDVQISFSDYWPSNPGYVEDMMFTFTESDHGIPNYEFNITITTIIDMGIDFNVQILSTSSGPSLTSISSDIPFRLQTGIRQYVFAGGLTLPYGAVLKDKENSGISFGSQAGQTDQNACAIAIGVVAGHLTQGSGSVAVGTYAGASNQGQVAVAVGEQAGMTSQGNGTVAIGKNAGTETQGQGAVAIGNQAGQYNQGGYAIALGAGAGQGDQHDNSIILNAAGGLLDSDGTSRFYVNPIRNDATSTNILRYNTTSKEITYGTLSSLVNSSHTISLDENGSLIFPDNTIQTTAFTGTGNIEFRNDSMNDINGIFITNASQTVAGTASISIPANTGGGISVTNVQKTTESNIISVVNDFTAYITLVDGITTIRDWSQRNLQQIEVNLFVDLASPTYSLLTGLALGRAAIVTYLNNVGDVQTFTSVVSQQFTSTGQGDPANNWVRVSGRIDGTLPTDVNTLALSIDGIDFPVDISTNKTWIFGPTGHLTVPGGIDKSDALILTSSGTTNPTWSSAVSLLGNSGSVVIRAIDGPTTKTWQFSKDGTINFPNNKLINNGELSISVLSGIPNTISNINSPGGWNGAGPFENLATTGGTGTGLRVSVGGIEGGYVNTVSIWNAGSGYSNGDVITAVGESTVTFTITVWEHDWKFGNNGSLTLPQYGWIQGNGNSSINLNAVGTNESIISLMTNLEGEGITSTINITPSFGIDLTSVRNVYIHAGYDYGTFRYDDWVGAEQSWVDVRNFDAANIAPETRPWAGMPSYTAYDIVIEYMSNPPVGAPPPPPSYISPTVSTAKTAYEQWQAEQASINVTVRAKDSIWIFDNDGKIQYPNSARQRDSNNTTCGASADTVIYTGTGPYIHTIKLIVQVEGQEGNGPWHTQSCEILVAKSFNNNSVAATVYAVVHTSVDPLATFTANWNSTSNRAEVKCRPTSITSNVTVRTFATEILTAD